MQLEKREIILKYGKSEKDTGNVCVQIGILAARINNITEHLRRNKKDIHTRTGMYKIVQKKRKLEKFLLDNNRDKYELLVKELNMRNINK